MKRSKPSRLADRRRREQRNRTLRVESLETRVALTAGITFTSRSGLLTIEGSAGNDTATVAVSGSNIVATLQTDAGTTSRTLKT